MTYEVKTEDISDDESETQIYELGFHIVPSVEEGKLPAEVDSIKAFIEKQGGAFIAEDFPKKIGLAYTITKDTEGKRNKFDTAYFGWVKFEMKTENIMNVKDEMDKNKNILRYLIIKTVKESTLAPKSAMAPKEEAPKQIKQKPILKTGDMEKKEGPKMTEEELDKTIEELIVE